MNIDGLFKASLLLILVVFLALFYQYSQNGRYAITPDGTLIVDTRTGKIYVVDANENRAFIPNAPNASKPKIN